MRTMRLLGIWAVAIGVWLMIAPSWLFGGGTWQNLVNDLAVGTLAIGAGLWRAYGIRGGRWATTVLAVLGLLETASPWLYHQTLPAARWNAVLCGLMLLGVATMAWIYHPADRPLHFTLFPDLFPDQSVPPASPQTQARLEKQLDRRRRPGA